MINVELEEPNSLRKCLNFFIYLLVGEQKKLSAIGNSSNQFLQRNLINFEIKFIYSFENKVLILVSGNLSHQSLTPTTIIQTTPVFFIWRGGGGPLVWRGKNISLWFPPNPQGKSEKFVIGQVEKFSLTNCKSRKRRG